MVPIAMDRWCPPVVTTVTPPTGAHRPWTAPSPKASTGYKLGMEKDLPAMGDGIPIVDQLHHGYTIPHDGIIEYDGYTVGIKRR